MWFVNFTKWLCVTAQTNNPRIMQRYYIHDWVYYYIYNNLYISEFYKYIVLICLCMSFTFPLLATMTHIFSQHKLQFQIILLLCWLHCFELAFRRRIRKWTKPWTSLASAWITFSRNIPTNWSSWSIRSYLSMIASDNDWRMPNTFVLEVLPYCAVS